MNEIHVSELYEDFVEIIGEENTTKIISRFSGHRVYFPKDIEKKIRDSKIKKDYWKKLKTYKELSKKYNLSQRWIRKILHS